MRYRFAVPAIFGFCLATGSLYPDRSFAGKAQLSQDYKNCMDSFVSEIDGARCGYDEIQRQDQLLDVAWKKESAILKKYASLSYPYLDCTGCDADEPLAHLLKEQQDWQQYKDSACEFWRFSGSGQDGTAFTYPYCKARIIAERISYLNGISEEFARRLSH